MSEDAEAVKRALRTLVDGRERLDRTEFEKFVEQAERAMEDVGDAAAFADADGFAALQSRVAAVEADRSDATLERAHAVLDVLADYRATAADHFHSGREGLMAGDPVSSDETT